MKITYSPNGSYLVELDSLDMMAVAIDAAKKLLKLNNGVDSLTMPAKAAAKAAGGWEVEFFPNPAAKAAAPASAPASPAQPAGRHVDRPASASPAAPQNRTVRSPLLP